MENKKNKSKSEPTAKNIKANTGYNPTDRDFQRTEEDIDDVSKSEKEALEERKKRTHVASSKPDKNHIG